MQNILRAIFFFFSRVIQLSGGRGGRMRTGDSLTRPHPSPPPQRSDKQTAGDDLRRQDDLAVIIVLSCRGVESADGAPASDRRNCLLPSAAALCSASRLASLRGLWLLVCVRRFRRALV